MADLFSVTAPLAIRFPDGSREIMIRRFPCEDGLIYLAPFWNRQEESKAFRFVAGPLKGEGPWKVGSAIVTVLGCHGTDPYLASEFQDWQLYLEQCGTDYPDDARIEQLAAQFIASRFD